MDNTKFQVTIGYKAVVNIDVKAVNEEEAKAKALEMFTNKVRKNMFNLNNASLQDDSYAAYGVLDMDNTWGTL